MEFENENVNIWNTEEEFRDWATKKHPAVLAIGEGEAKIVATNAFGPQWFGPEDGKVTITAPFYVRRVLGVPVDPENLAPLPEFEWPPAFDFGPWRLVFVSGSEAADRRSAVYQQGQAWAAGLNLNPIAEPELCEVTT